MLIILCNFINYKMICIIILMVTYCYQVVLKSFEVNLLSFQ